MNNAKNSKSKMELYHDFEDKVFNITDTVREYLITFSELQKCVKISSYTFKPVNQLDSYFLDEKLLV
jgi:hypothetical protein